MDWKNLDSKVCSIKRALAVFGDRWTFLIIRDAFIGSRRFSDFRKSLDVPKHRLSDRLTRLVEEGIFEKQAVNVAQTRYEYRLTQKGYDLMPVMLALVQWGDKHMDDGDGPPLRHFHTVCGNELKSIGLCPDCGEPVTHENYSIKLGPGLQAKLARGESIPEMQAFTRPDSGQTKR